MALRLKDIAGGDNTLWLALGAIGVLAALGTLYYQRKQAAASGDGPGGTLSSGLPFFQSAALPTSIGGAGAASAGGSAGGGISDVLTAAQSLAGLSNQRSFADNGTLLFDQLIPQIIRPGTDSIDGSFSVLGGVTTFHIDQFGGITPTGGGSGNPGATPGGTGGIPTTFSPASSGATSLTAPATTTFYNTNLGDTQANSGGDFGIGGPSSGPSAPSGDFGSDVVGGGSGQAGPGQGAPPGGGEGPVSGDPSSEGAGAGEFGGGEFGGDGVGDGGDGDGAA